MKRHMIVATIGVCLVSVVLVGQQSAVTEEIRTAERAMEQAAAKRDAAAYGRFLTDDFTWTDRLGRTQTKAEMLKALAPSNPGDKTSEESCALYGTGAVCTGARHLVEPNVQARYLRAWVKRAGRWQMAAHQGVTITPPPATPPPTAAAAEAPAAAAPPPATVSGAAEKEILAALNALAAANAKADATAFAQLVTNDFIGIGPQGQTRTKASRIEQIKGATAREPRPFAGRDLRIRFYDTLAVVIWRSGEQGQTQNMAVMVKEKVRWLRAGVIATTAETK